MSFFVIRFSFILVTWLFLLLLGSCSSKQRWVQRQQQTAKFETQQAQLLASQTQLVRRYWQNDSSSIKEQILIYPDGAIQFGPYGFVGKAKALVLLRQQDQKRQSTGMLTSTNEVLQKQEERAISQTKQSEKEVQTQTQRWLSLGAVMLMVLLALAYWYWRKR
ncbi:DUF4381 domain-containing protein [Pedobacter helvus]|uniref:DUF4381 domain-containing protein n=1 Tax=Pedobacter helvus TaxID=2563444 RepID=A0ABW9JN14_9SPHI|nr:DUF4381 domain-containing protein [Pedobacter ureilyticus]